MTEFEKVVRSVPRRPASVWQVAVVQLPVWVRDEEGGAFRPEAALCIDANEDLVESTEPGLEGAVPAAELVRTVLVRAIRSWEHAPDTLAIADPALSAGLRKEFAGTGVSVRVEPELRALERVLSAMAESFAAGLAFPDILSGEGVTVAGVAAFAQAARRFYEAAPWRFLSNEDLVRVEAPKMEAGLRDVVVMGEGGMQHGLMFFNGPGQFAAVERGEMEIRLAMIEEGVWSVSFEDSEEAAPADVEVWEEHGFPLAGHGLLPMAARLGRSPERPDARVLAFFEGLLSALAETTEEEIDSGRWEKEVQTVRGPLRFRLALPGLLELLDDGKLSLKPEEEDREDFAADLLVEAEEARGRQRIHLARRALELAPDFAEAYGMLGDLAPSPEKALDLYTRGLALAERELGPEIFEDYAGSFGELLETEEYMHLRTSVARTLEKLGRSEEAAEHYEEMLRLDPEDEMGLRYELLDLLLETLKNYEQAEQLLVRFEDDPHVAWPYAWALVGFLREGEESPETQRRLREALRRNRYVPDYLLERRPLPDELPFSPRPGSEAEAALYAGGAPDLWELSPGALEWLDFWVPLLAGPSKVGKKRAKKTTKKKKRRR